MPARLRVAEAVRFELPLCPDRYEYVPPLRASGFRIPTKCPQLRHVCHKVCHKLLGVILCGLLTASAHADEWEPLDTKLEIAWLALDTADMMQTLDIKNHSDRRETNKTFGSHPSDAKVIGLFAAGAAIHYGISSHLPAPYRTWYQGASILLAAGIVAHNHAMGMQFSF